MNANKYFLLIAIVLLALLPTQIILKNSFVPTFAQDPNTMISKIILTYGENDEDKKSRKIDYRLLPYLWNRFLLLTSIHFDSGENTNTQFLITFWPQKIYSIKYINKLVDVQETKYFDLPEQHVLFNGNDENFQVLVDNSYQYCYVQLSNSSVQCVDIRKIMNN